MRVYENLLVLTPHLEGLRIDNIPKLHGLSVQSWSKFFFIREQKEGQQSWMCNSHGGDYRLGSDAM
jgi:hypothetical protein